MANLDFRTATQAEATAYPGDGSGSDVIVFSTGTAIGTTFTVNPASGGNPETITVTNGGRSLNFSRAAISGPNSFQFADASVLIYGGVGSDAVTGGVFGDYLLGNNGNDTLDGGAGADYLHGNAGNDQLNGGDGADTVLGGQGDDSITGGNDNDVLFGDLGNDTIDGGAGADLIQGNLGDDVLVGGVGSDTIRGGQGNDCMTGGDDNDVLFGDLGNDTLVGGSGIDTLSGGAGNDVFVFANGESGITQATVDTVTDFNAGDSFDIGFLTSPLGVAGYSETTNADFAGALAVANQAFANTTTTSVVVVALTNGSGAYVFFDNLNGAGTTATEVIFVAGGTLNNLSEANFF